MINSGNAAKQALWLCLVLLALCSSGWYFANSPPVIKLDNQTLSATPDTIIHHLTVKQFDSKGQLSHYLKTPLLRHIPLDNVHQLTTPNIMISRKAQSPWKIDAKFATAIHGGKQIKFTDHVIIHQQPDGAGKEATLETDELIYFPKTQLATTTKHVTIIQAGNRVESVGMNAYLAENRVQLLSNARGYYAPAHG